jgi:Zn-dependent oligopeptidase
MTLYLSHLSFDLHRVLQLRQKIASLLGFSDWADYKISDKMAKTGNNAISFIQNIDDRLDDVFLAEQKILLDLKREHLNDPTVSELDRWDLGYYMNILMETEYQINQDEIAEYFEEEATLRGIFDIYEELFNIKITEDPDGPPGGLWADDDSIKFVHISEAGEDGSPIGGVYLDLHPRPGKYTHFAKFSLVKGYRMTDPVSGTSTYQAPHCAIIGNWPVPVGNETVSLWKFSNVNTFFHEFGHALHDVLTCTEMSSFSGTSVAWDFVEVPSQMLERWLDDINVIRRFAKHYKNGNSMPEALLQSLIRAKTATVGHGYKGQVALGM